MKQISLSGRQALLHTSLQMASQELNSAGPSRPSPGLLSSISPTPSDQASLKHDTQTAGCPCRVAHSRVQHPPVSSNSSFFPVELGPPCGETMPWLPCFNTLHRPWKSTGHPAKRGKLTMACCSTRQITGVPGASKKTDERRRPSHKETMCNQSRPRAEQDELTGGSSGHQVPGGGE